MPRRHSKRSHRKSHVKRSHRKSPVKRSHRKSPVKKSHRKSQVKGHYRSISKSKRIRVKSHYRMRGMGPLLSMYGMVGQGLEEDYNFDKMKLAQTKAEYEAEKDLARREQLRLLMESARVKMNNAKDKMSEMLKGVRDAASKASDNLSNGAKMLGSKLSSGAKVVGSKLSSGAKSLISRLSSGAKNLSSRLGSNVSSGIQSAKKSYSDYKDNKDKALYASLQNKYGSSSVSSSE